MKPPLKPWARRSHSTQTMRISNVCSAAACLALGRSSRQQRTLFERRVDSTRTTDGLAIGLASILAAPGARTRRSRVIDEVSPFARKIPRPLQVLPLPCRRRAGWTRWRQPAARVIERDSGNAEAHKNLGLVAMQGGRHDEAAASFRRALHLRPDDRRVRNDLGVVLGRMGRRAGG